MRTHRSSRWHRYLDLLLRSGVPERYRPWYIRHVEALIARFPERKLSNLSAAEITDYLREFQNEANPKQWQLRQRVDALRLLLVDLLNSDAAHQVDWDGYWVLPENRAEGNPVQISYPEKSGAPVSAEWRHRLSVLQHSLRSRRYALRTERAYVDWVRRFALFCQKHDKDPDSSQARAFIEWLVIERKVSKSTQNQAINSLAYFFNHVLKMDLKLGDFQRSRRPRRLPVVLSVPEVQRLLDELDGMHALMATLLYGTGMRLMEVLRLRVQDVDFDRRVITVRRAKGDKDRVVPLPERCVQTLQQHLAKRRLLHREDVKAGCGRVYLPDALARKYPQAAEDWGWQFVFVSKSLSRHQASCGATIYTRPVCNGQSGWQPGEPALPSR